MNHPIVSRAHWHTDSGLSSDRIKDNRAVKVEQVLQARRKTRSFINTFRAKYGRKDTEPNRKPNDPLT